MLMPKVDHVTRPEVLSSGWDRELIARIDIGKSDNTRYVTIENKYISLWQQKWRESWSIVETKELDKWYAVVIVETRQE